MLEEFITNFLINKKKYLRCIIAFICALLLVQYGVIKTIFIIVVSFIGYLSGSSNFIKIFKKFYKDNIK
ncbi:MAG: DUF2273 domain-containing protein [Fusobacteriaceae bacterium]